MSDEQEKPPEPEIVRARLNSYAYFYRDARQENPGGTYYIYDGVHKSIVLAKKLFRREIEYEPVEALLLIPRRS